MDKKDSDNSIENVGDGKVLTSNKTKPQTAGANVPSADISSSNVSSADVSSTKVTDAKASSAEVSRKEVSNKESLDEKTSSEKIPGVKVTVSKIKGTENDSVSASHNNAGVTSKKSNRPKPTVSKKPKTSNNRGWLVFSASLLFIIIVGIAGIGVAGYLAYPEYQKYQNVQLVFEKKLESLSAGLVASNAKTNQLVKNLTDNNAGYKKRLELTESRLDSTTKRLRALSSTSREDWLLAEAEYLLKLANQRIVIEKHASNAIALLEEADEILRAMDELELRPLRAAITRDLAALKLADAVDFEGLYLQLNALAEQVENLPLYTSTLSELGRVDEVGGAVANENNGVLVSSFKRFLEKYKDYIRVVDLDENSKGLISTESTLYLQQNLRLTLERSQLALLREHEKIYQQSLQQAQTWVLKYFPVSERSQKFNRELASLSQKNIIQELPDISHSLELLHVYIDSLHRLGSVNQNQGASL
ncbi:MAG: uroporphyrin-3 C-methyltransferase [Flavobacteriales bacterium]|jgi:uroporphyrin-3 C-methyltransferase